MTELILDRDRRLALKAQSHHLDPVVLLGAQGLSEAVMREIDRALTAHELIKVRLTGDDRDQREQMFAHAADELGAARVQMIGKIIVLFRPRPRETEETQEAAAAAGGTGAKRSRATAARPGAAKSARQRQVPRANPRGTHAKSGAPRRTARGR